MRKYLPLITLTCAALIMIFAFYGKVVLRPDHYMFGTHGDGIKNYYTFYYHINHDDNPFETKGMNYPYGESYLYTDCQPVLTHIIRMAGHVFPAIPAKSIGILNLLMILSLFFTFFLVYRILLEYDVFPWIAVLFAIAITALQPQIFRMPVHMSMSYSVAIPLTWLLIIKIRKARRRALYLSLLMVSNLFWMFIIAYVGMILLFFQACIWIVSMLYERRQLVGKLGYLALTAIPVLVYIIFTRLTDHHIGRTTQPWGFFYYNAEPDDLFLPHHPPLRPIWNMLLKVEIAQKWEAWNYIGFSFTLMMALLVILVLYKLFTRRTPLLLNHFTKNHHLNISFIASLLVLLYAMGIPFRQFPALADIFPFVRQFRTTGRFAWVFYYTASVFSVYMIQSLYLKYFYLGKKRLAYLIVAATAILTTWEGLPYHQDISIGVGEQSNIFAERSLSREDREILSIVRKSDFQAVLPLPFFYWGSENFSRPRKYDVVTKSFCLSANSGLPLIPAFSSRTSIPESKAIIQLMSPSFYYKPVKNAFPDDRPLLVLKVNDRVTEYEAAIIERSTMLYEGPTTSLFRIELNDLFRSRAAEEFHIFDSLKNNLLNVDGFLVRDSSDLIIYNGFESEGFQADVHFRGNDAFIGKKREKYDLGKINGGLDPSVEYVASAWMFNGRVDALNESLRLMVNEYDPEMDKWYTSEVMTDQSEVINGDWSLIELPFSVRSENNELYFSTEGTSFCKGSIIADDLLVYKKGSVIYREYLSKDERALFKNNHEIRDLQGQ